MADQDQGQPMDQDFGSDDEELQMALLASLAEVRSSLARRVEGLARDAPRFAPCGSLLPHS